VKPETQTIQDVIEAAFRDIGFMNHLIDNPRQAMIDRGWKLEPDEMKTIENLVSRPSVHQIRASMTNLCQDLEVNPPDPPTLTNVWLCPTPKHSGPGPAESK
jgi:hypothetical protein